MIKELLSVFLGVGKGWVGSGIRLAVGLAAGWFTSKGIDIDAGTVSSITDGLVGLGLAVLAYIGSLLNNKVTS